MGNPSHHLGWGEMDYVPRKMSILMQAATSAHGSRNASFFVFFLSMFCVCLFVFLYTFHGNEYSLNFLGADF